MKNLLYLINLFLIVSFISFITSCGNKSGEEKKALVCNCSQLKWENQIAKLDSVGYTGSCELKNAQNEIVELSEFNNGYRLSFKEWKDVNKKLVQITDLKYYDNKIDSGYTLYIDYNESFTPIFFYVKKYTEYKNGKEIYNYELESDKSYIGYDMVGNIYGYCNYVKITKNGDYGNSESSCRTDPKENFLFYTTIESKHPKVLEWFKCVESLKLPKFFHTGSEIAGS